MYLRNETQILTKQCKSVQNQRIILTRVLIILSNSHLNISWLFHSFRKGYLLIVYIPWLTGPFHLGSAEI